MADTEKFTIASFLKTGCLGPLRTGMSLRETVRRIGKPEGTRRFRADQKQWGVIWKYYSLQLTFLNDTISMIKLDSFDTFRLPKPLKIDDSPVYNMDLNEFFQYLDAEGLEYVIDQTHTFEYQSAFIVESRVRVIFNNSQALASMSTSQFLTSEE